jgi:hypothetical protein
MRGVWDQVGTRDVSRNVPRRMTDMIMARRQPFYFRLVPTNERIKLTGGVSNRSE